jgi:hypothetical protein
MDVSGTRKCPPEFQPINSPQLDVKPIIDDSEDEELKYCSREIDTFDERHLVVGPADSVEPRYDY